MERADHVRDWLHQLGARIAPSMNREEFVGRANMLAVDLAEEMPIEAFTRESMLAVARQHKFWPNFAEFCQALEPWVQHRRENLRLLALPPPREESREPYNPGPAPDWCFDRGSRFYNPGRLPQARPPLRTVAQQLAELGHPLKAAAQPVVAEVKRGPVLQPDA